MFTIDFINPYITYIIYISLFMGLALWMAFFPKQVRKHKRLVFLGFFTLISYSQIVRYLIPWLTEGTINYPFFVSRLAALLMLVYFIFKIRALHAILYFWTATGILAVFVPMGSPAHMDILPETFLIDHFVAGVFPLYLLIVKDYTPSCKEAHIYALVLLIIFVVYIPFAQHYGWNYFFMHDDNILFDIFPTLNWYMFALLKAFGLWIYFLGCVN